MTDVSNASRTMLMNLRTGDWDADLLRIFDIPRAMLPAIRPSSGVVGAGAGRASGRGNSDRRRGGRSAGRARRASLLPRRIIEEHLRHRLFRADAYGRPRAGLAATVCWRRAPRPWTARAFAIEGSVFIAGAAVQWLRDKLGVIAAAAESEALAESIPDNGGVYLVPAFVGLGAPHWDSAARGLITGLTAATEPRAPGAGRARSRSPIRRANWWKRWRPTRASG